MGFCGCSLHASTISAGVYGILFSIYGISWSSALINAISKWKPLDLLMDPYVSQLFSSENIFFLKSDKVIYWMLISTLVLHVAWICSSIAMLIGNERKNTASLQVWVAIVSTVIISDFAFSIYAAVKPSDVCGVLRFHYAVQYAGICYAYLLVAALFFKFGLISMGIEIALAIYVSNRAKEMKIQAQGPSQIMICSPATQYVIPGGNAVTMQSYPSDFNQTPGNYYSQYAGAQGSTRPSPFEDRPKTYSPGLTGADCVFRVEPYFIRSCTGFPRNNHKKSTVEALSAAESQKTGKRDSRSTLLREEA